MHCKAVLEPLLDEIFYISVIPVLRHSHVEIMKSDFPFYLLSLRNNEVIDVYVYLL